MTTKPLRLGVFGGAFDPPHVAHVALARAAVDELELDELHVLPTGQAWHRPQALTPAADRLAMAQEAFGRLPRTVVDDREVRRAGPTYTIDTLRELQIERPGAQLVLLMGQDQAQAFTRWREWQAIAAMALLCVVSRGTAATDGTETAVEANAQAWMAAMPPGTRVRALSLPLMFESATQVRERIAAGREFAHLVPAGVARYIDQHHLYRNP